jgi:hypothetical protein
MPVQPSSPRKTRPGGRELLELPVHFEQIGRQIGALECRLRDTYFAGDELERSLLLREADSDT